MTRRRSQVPGRTGARFPRAPAAEPAVEAPDPPAPPEAEPAAPVTSALPVTEPSAGAVRPYVLTGGRTRASLDLSLDTLVTAGPAAGREAGHDAAVLVELCRTPRSVAEIAACTGVPLGVARVQVSELVLAGVLAVDPAAVPDAGDLDLLHRVLAGLHRL